jgi:hypothetical protein
VVSRIRGFVVLAATIAVVAALAAPASASAANTYADANTGDDGNDCTDPATPCLTIGAALLQSGPGDTTFVADGTYAETVDLDQGKSLESLDSSDPRPVIDNGSSTGITVCGCGAGSISGLRLLSSGTAIELDGPATVEDNVFEATGPDASLIKVETSSAVIDGNTFNGSATANGFQLGVAADGPDPVVSDNTFTGLADGVLSVSGNAQISGNQFSGAHPIGPSVLGDLPGVGVLVLAGSPTITENTFEAPAQHPSAGVYIGVFPTPGPPPSGATLSHNEVGGNDVGVQIIDSNSSVTLSNDLIYDNTVGIESTDTSADSPPSTQGDVSAVNETIFDNAVDASVSYTTLTLDSSILGSPIDVVGNNGACDITYSSGSSASSNGCGNFDTNAAPQFVDAASGDYQLQSTSPLIDVGDPASPGPGAVDFYGGPRELQGKQCSTARRDIGAAEYDPGTTPGCPPPPSPPAPTPTPTPTLPPAAPKINKQPDKRSDDTTPTFKFSGEVPGSTFRCKLDGAPYRACSSPKTYRGLDVGRHVFRVYAVDPSGLKGSPRVIRFTVTN